MQFMLGECDLSSADAFNSSRSRLINTVDSNGFTPVHNAVWRHDFFTLALLLGEWREMPEAGSLRIMAGKPSQQPPGVEHGSSGTAEGASSFPSRSQSRHQLVSYPGIKPGAPIAPVADLMAMGRDRESDEAMRPLAWAMRRALERLIAL